MYYFSLYVNTRFSLKLFQCSENNAENYLRSESEPKETQLHAVIN
jgi:hypothetical protein